MSFRARLLGFRHWVIQFFQPLTYVAPQVAHCVRAGKEVERRQTGQFPLEI